MAEISTRVSPDSSPADLVTRAVDMHPDRGGDCPEKENVAPVPSIKELRVLRKAQDDHASSQNQVSRALNDNCTTRTINSISRNSPKTVTREPNLAHQAARRRLNGTSSNRGASSSGSSSATEPVIVCQYSNPISEVDPLKQLQMKKNRKSKADPKYDLPSLESFSFQDILASIDPEVKSSIDSIAEICGRSRMSLADEYGSHLPPQAEFIPPHEREDVSNAIPTHLGTLYEASSPYSELPQPHHHDRRNFANLNLIAAMNQRSTAVPSVSPATSPLLHSEARPEFSRQEPARVPIVQPDDLLSHVTAWLRRSSASFAGFSDPSHQIEKDITATDALHKILNKLQEPEPAAQS